MRDLTDNLEHCRGLAAWAKFVAGSLLLTGAVLALMQGYTPPGPAGEVFRNNLRNGIDATPLFYTECNVSADAEAKVIVPHDASDPHAIEDEHGGYKVIPECGGNQ